MYPPSYANTHHHVTILKFERILLNIKKINIQGRNLPFH